MPRRVRAFWRGDTVLGNAVARAISAGDVRLTKMLYEHVDIDTGQPQKEQESERDKEREGGGRETR